ncbi:hypothetical protein KKF34_01250 [Myxococcota bacterium]|nr:hypothetical protein [Myxococcota bacterium]MBU1382961.1 hypothetical protein [Myxococcota bacterium]MBU1495487.1 hypothetical protein [Myxococcota bacterium]
MRILFLAVLIIVFSGCNKKPEDKMFCTKLFGELKKCKVLPLMAEEEVFVEKCFRFFKDNKNRNLFKEVKNAYNCENLLLATNRLSFLDMEPKKSEVNSGKFKKAKEVTTRLKLDNISSVMTESNEEPEHKGMSGPELLNALIKAGMIKKPDLKDAWGNTIFVKKVGDGFCVISSGPDLIQNTNDDIKSKDCR